MPRRVAVACPVGLEHETDFGCVKKEELNLSRVHTVMGHGVVMRLQLGVPLVALALVLFVASSADARRHDPPAHLGDAGIPVLTMDSLQLERARGGGLVHEANAKALASARAKRDRGDITDVEYEHIVETARRLGEHNDNEQAEDVTLPAGSTPSAVEDHLHPPPFDWVDVLLVGGTKGRIQVPKTLPLHLRPLPAAKRQDMKHSTALPSCRKASGASLSENQRCAMCESFTRFLVGSEAATLATNNPVLEERANVISLMIDCKKGFQYETVPSITLGRVPVGNASAACAR